MPTTRARSSSDSHHTRRMNIRQQTRWITSSEESASTCQHQTLSVTSPEDFFFNCASAYIYPQPDITSLDNGITSLRHQTRSVTSSEKCDLVSPILNVITRVSRPLMIPLSRIYIKFGVSRPPFFFSFRVVVCGSISIVDLSI